MGAAEKTASGERCHCLTRLCLSTAPVKAEGAEVVITKEMEEEEKLAMEEGERKEKAMMERV